MAAKTTYVQIRPVQVGDVDSLRENCFSLNTPEEMRAIVDVAQANADHGEGVMFVVLDDAHAGVGNVTLTRESHRLRRHRVRMGGFVIHPSAQGSGLARRLTKEAAEWCRARSCSILELDCRGGTHAE